eukprot:5070478-Prymnesium_polylepis.1
MASSAPMKPVPPHRGGRVGALTNSARHGAAWAANCASQGLAHATGMNVRHYDHAAASREHYDQLCSALDRQAERCYVNGRHELKACKEAAVAAFEQHVPHLTINHTAQMFDDCRRLMRSNWGFVREERHAHHIVWSSAVGYGRTATYERCIEILQQRLVDKYVEKCARVARYRNLMEAVSETNAQLDRI